MTFEACGLPHQARKSLIRQSNEASAVWEIVAKAAMFRCVSAC
jgi:hypothetical protein